MGALSLFCLCAFLPLSAAGYFVLSRFRPLWARIFLGLCGAVFFVLSGWQFALAALLLLLLVRLCGQRKTSAVILSLLCAFYMLFARIFAWPYPEGMSFLLLGCVCLLRSPLSLPETLEYGFFFPKAAAGPVTRTEEFRPGVPSEDDLFEGLHRLILGLSQKLLLADSLRRLAACAFQSAFPWPLRLLGAVACPLMVYFDFAGYTDMALGMARLFGVRLPENFDRPFSAVSMRDFWRRWHMSLSRFLRDFMYIPLGGSRKGNARTALNLALVFLLMGLWHGPNLPYLLFGVWNALFVILEHLKILRPDRWSLPARRLYTLTVVCAGFVCFCVPTLNTTLLPPDLPALSALIAGLVVLIVPEKSSDKIPKKIPAGLRAALLLVLLVVCLARLAGNGFSPFLYAGF